MALAAVLVFGFMIFAPTASAAKPVPVIDWSNGFPSGPHFNLNIHGKKSDPLANGGIFNCPGPNFVKHPDPLKGYGGSVFVPEYESDVVANDGPPTVIKYFQNKRSNITELTTHDACAGYFDNDGTQVVGFDEDTQTDITEFWAGNDDPINIQLPKGEYQVYARILA